jgi:hypothetical protein
MMADVLMMIITMMKVGEEILEVDVRQSFVSCCGRKVWEVAMVALSSGFMEGSSQQLVPSSSSSR